MDRNDLILTAQKLTQVNEDHASEFSSKIEHLVDIMNQKMAARADILDLVGANNLGLMKDNHANHARFLESIFCQYSPETLVDTVLWVFRAYRSRNFASTYWAAQLNAWIEIYKKELSTDCYNAVYPYYNWMQINIPHFVKLSDEVLESRHSAH
jgi:hypothetical protein